MAACPEFELLLDLHATEALETGEAARVEQHVRACDGCREALASTVDVLGMAELPPLTAAEKAVVQELPQRTLGAWRWYARHRGRGLGMLGAVMAAAVAALVLMMPALFGDSVTGQPAAEAVVDAETMAAIEAWAGLEPLDGDALDGDALEDEAPDFDLGETL